MNMRMKGYRVTMTLITTSISAQCSSVHSLVTEGELEAVGASPADATVNKDSRRQPTEYYIY